MKIVKTFFNNDNNVNDEKSVQLFSKRIHQSSSLTSMFSVMRSPSISMIIFNLSFFWSFWFTILIDRSKVNGQYDWQKSDTFDEIRLKLDSVTSDSCKVLDVNRLFLPHSTVTHVPNLQWLGIDPIFPNRTNLLHVHNLALSRAFFLR